MGYGDYTPSSRHSKKPLTRVQLEKMQKAYKNADAIIDLVKEQESKEKSKDTDDLDSLLQSL